MVVNATLVPEMGWGLMAWFDSPNVIGLCQLTYLAYYASHQIMWVDIPRDMWAMGFPAAFQKHVGLTVDEFAESFSNFMNSGSLDDPTPEGFFTEKPLSEMWISVIKDKPQRHSPVEAQCNLITRIYLGCHKCLDNT